MDAYRDQYAKLFNDGKKVTLLAVSVDPIGELASWAKDRNYPFRFLSDPDGKVGKLYGAFDSKYKLDNRTLYVIAPSGKISYVAAEFQEVDPQAYVTLGEAVQKSVGGTSQ
ncbi:MAG TPA: redoxin domain-containing protein [Gemmatimonadales bacterium]|jgi:peroxiredoxin|nr:redoxin domain-containing protein [Gemmatimonadales bacterium]